MKTLTEAVQRINIPVPPASQSGQVVPVPHLVHNEGMNIPVPPTSQPAQIVAAPNSIHNDDMHYPNMGAESSAMCTDNFSFFTEEPFWSMPTPESDVNVQPVTLFEHPHTQVQQSAISSSPPSTPNCTPLHVAVRTNNESIVRLLIASGADPTLVDDSGFTPLQLAIECGHSSLLPILLQRCDPNVRDLQGRSLLFESIRREDAQMVEALLQGCVDPNQADYAGNLPLHLAISIKSEAMTKLLIDNGADVNR